MDSPTHILAERQTSDASRVTVAISLHNYRDYVTSCLDSVGAQTIPSLDLIVVDDCSSDEGADEVRRWLDENGDRFGRYLLARHATNCGLAAARNTAFARARTEYVFVLDADNLLYPRCLQQLAMGLDESSASFGFCYLEKFGAAAGLHNISPWRPSSLQRGNTIDAMTMIRRSVWESVGGYSVDMPAMGWEDFDLWFKVARINGWGIQIPEVLGRYRVHLDSMIRTVTNPRIDELWEYLRARYPESFTQTDN